MPVRKLSIIFLAISLTLACSPGGSSKESMPDVPKKDKIQKSLTDYKDEELLSGFKIVKLCSNAYVVWYDYSKARDFFDEYVRRKNCDSCDEWWGSFFFDTLSQGIEEASNRFSGGYKTVIDISPVNRDGYLRGFTVVFEKSKF